MSAKLLKSTSTVGAMTMLSRISGLVRDMVLANMLGSGAGADAFFVAFRIPNFLRRIFGEGAFAAAFVPVLSDYQTNHEAREIRSFLDVMTGRLLLILLVVTAIGTLSAPAIVALLAPGFRVEDPQRFVLTVDALRIVFPYLTFISLVAMAGGILNANDRFAVPAATPILLNLCLVASVFSLASVTPNATIALSIGVFVAGVVQLAVQVPALRQINSLPRPRLTGDPVAVSGAGRVFKLMLPAIAGTSVAQINMVVNTILASFLASGSVSWLYYSDRLMEFPLGVFGIALATAILPGLSRLYAKGENEAFNETLDWGLRLSLLIAAPASVGLIVLAGPMLTTIFYHGAFSQHAVIMSSSSLVAFSAGLVAFIGVKILAPAFYARQNTRTPVRIAMIAVAMNIVFSLLLVGVLAHTGLALATTLSACVNAGLLYITLRREKVYQPLDGWLRYLVQVSLASAAMGCVLWWLKGTTEAWFAFYWLERIARLAGLIVVGGIVYFSVILLTGVRLRSLLTRASQ